LYVYLKSTYIGPEKVPELPDLELWWYARFLKHMHLVMFIAILLSNIFDFFVRLVLAINQEGPPPLDSLGKATKKFYDGFYETP
jgi:hypothetical protein